MMLLALTVLVALVACDLLRRSPEPAEAVVPVVEDEQRAERRRA